MKNRAKCFETQMGQMEEYEGSQKAEGRDKTRIKKDNHLFTAGNKGLERGTRPSGHPNKLLWSHKHHGASPELRRKHRLRVLGFWYEVEQLLWWAAHNRQAMKQALQRGLVGSEEKTFVASLQQQTQSTRGTDFIATMSLTKTRGQDTRIPWRPYNLCLVGSLSFKRAHSAHLRRRASIKSLKSKRQEPPSFFQKGPCLVGGTFPRLNCLVFPHSKPLHLPPKLSRPCPFAGAEQT